MKKKKKQGEGFESWNEERFEIQEWRMEKTRTFDSNSNICSTTQSCLFLDKLFNLAELQFYWL